MYVLWALFHRRSRPVFSFAERLAEQLKNEVSLQISVQDFFEKHWAANEKGIADGLRKRLSTLFSAPPALFDGDSR